MVQRKFSMNIVETHRLDHLKHRKIVQLRRVTHMLEQYTKRLKLVHCPQAFKQPIKIQVQQVALKTTKLG